MSMPSVDVLIFVEHLVRELDAACVLKHYLEKKHKLSVKIASSPYESRYVVSHYQPWVVCLPNIRSYMACAGPVTFWWERNTLVNFSCEQILSRVNEAANIPHDPKVKNTTKYFCWGERFKQFLAKHKVPEKNIELTGSPNFGLLDEKYHFLCRDRAQLAKDFNLDPNKRWMFIPENYGWAFLDDYQFEKKISGTQAYSREIATSYRQFHKDGLAMLISWLEKTEDLDDVQVILRPRPATLLSLFEDRFKGKVPKNVRLIKEGSCREWLLASDAIFSNYSTVLVDASVAGKPTFLLQDGEIPEMLSADFLKHVPRINKYDYFREVFQGQHLEENIAQNNLRDYALENFHIEEDPFEKMADLIAGMRKDMKKPPRFLYGRGWYRMDTSWRRFIPFNLRMAVSLLLTATDYPDKDAPPAPYVEKSFSNDRLTPEMLAEVEAKVADGLRS